MRKHILALFVLAALPTRCAEADEVSSRVVLKASLAHPCPSGGYEFRRFLENPDGTSSLEASPFVVPSGQHLDVTDVQIGPSSGYPSNAYTEFNFSLRVYKRTASSYWIFFTARLAPRPHVLYDGAVVAPTGEFLDDRKYWVNHAFGTGPFVSPSGRLCVGVNSPSNFFNLGGSVTLRGRLLGTALPVGGGGGAALP